MDTNFTFRNLEPTEGLKDHALQRITKADKYLLKPLAAHIIFSHDKFRQKCEVTLIDNGVEYVGSDTSPDMYLSIDKAVDKVVRQLKKKKEIAKAHKPGRT